MRRPGFTWLKSLRVSRKQAKRPNSPFFKTPDPVRVCVCVCVCVYVCVRVRVDGTLFKFKNVPPHHFITGINKVEQQQC
jgi:hypothetical protein